MNNHLPIISIVIPTFNRSDLISQTLLSVKSQTYGHWECIIVDDGSTQEHKDLVSGFIADDARFRLIERVSEPKGAPHCRNLGWKSAKGKYVIFLDSDDLLDESCLELRLESARLHPTFDFLVFSTLIFDEIAGDNNVLINVLTIEEPIHRFLKMDVIWLATGVLWKKVTLEKLGGWDDKLLSWQDWDLSVRALLAGCRFKHFAQVDNYWRNKNSKNASIGHFSTTSKEHLQSHQYLLDKIASIIMKSGDKALLNLHANNYFWLACKWTTRGQVVKGLRVWRSARQFVLSGRYFINMLILFVLILPGRKQLLMQLERRNYPGLTAWKATFKRVLFPSSYTS